MSFDAAAYGPDVQRLLQLDGSGLRLIPLAKGRCSSLEACEMLGQAGPRQLFPHGFAPEAAVAGLWVYFSDLDRAHEISQDIETVEGSFWHGIVHRQEPDASNAKYWFRRVGDHPTFPALLRRAETISEYHNVTGIRLKEKWDPFLFIDFCEEARQRAGSPEEHLAMELQAAEWQLLFDFCARPVSGDSV